MIIYDALSSLMRQLTQMYLFCFWCSTSFLTIWTLIFFQSIPGLVLASGLKSDETVMLFKVDAYQKTLAQTHSKTKKEVNNVTGSSHKKNIWLAPIHAWVYEEENDSLWRNKLIEQILDEAELDKNDPQYQHNHNTLHNSLKLFIVDSQSFKTLQLSIDNQAFSFGRSGFNGHIQDTIELSTHQDKALLDVVLNEPALHNDKKFRKSIIRLIPNQGVSIISDIDDTIKESHVLDKKELIKNTFLRPAKPVKLMNFWYQCLLKDFSDQHKSRAYFHYISASPWQLYPMLEDFLQQFNFPSGSLYLRNFRFKDRSFLSFLKPSTEYKIATISQLIERYPNREFILIGDSGEHDPEIYGRILRKFPAQVKRIYIRKVPGSELSTQRFHHAFNSIESDRWILFDRPQVPELTGPDTSSLTTTSCPVVEE